MAGLGVPVLGPALPRFRSVIGAALGRMFLRALGWRIEGSLPDCAKFVLIVAPHTSNWEVPIGLAVKLSLRLSCSYMAKDSAFWWPLGAFLRATGGISINRKDAGDIVGASVKEFERRSSLILIITPEGTRKRVKAWKSGFHRIARGARVPIVLVVFDYARKVARLGPTFAAGEDYAADVAKIQSHVKSGMARYPAGYAERDEE